MRVPIGIAHRIPGEPAAPNRMITRQKMLPTIVDRVAVHAICPNAIASGVSGVANIAW